MIGSYLVHQRCISEWVISLPCQVQLGAAASMREIAAKLVVCSCGCSQVDRLGSLLMVRPLLLLVLLLVLIVRLLLGGLMFLS